MASLSPFTNNQIPNPPHHRLPAETDQDLPYCIIPLPPDPSEDHFAHQCSFSILSICTSTTTTDDDENNPRLQRWLCKCGTIFCPNCRAVVLDPTTKRESGYAWHYKKREPPVEEERAADSELETRAEELTNSRHARRELAKARRRNSGSGVGASVADTAPNRDGVNVEGGRVSKPASTSSGSPYETFVLCGEGEVP